MINLLSAPLPQVWEGRVIDPDYRLMIRLANAHARGETQQDPLAFAQQICQAFYKCPITTAQLPDAYAALLRFYAAGLPRRQEEDAAEAGGPSGPAFDYAEDSSYILAAFQQAYGIDLTASTMHWWRFRALLGGLPDTCLFSRIIGWRTADLTEMPDYQRRYYEQQRQRFALPPELKGGAPIAQTIQQHEDAFLARLRRH